MAKVSTIPFELSNGLILISAQVNDDVVGTFIFDTGTSDILINGHSASSEEVVFESLNGNISTKKIHLKSLKLGDIKKVGLPAYLTDLSGIEDYVDQKIYGILSGAYFSPNEVFIDLKNRVIEVSPSFDFKEYSHLYLYSLSEEHNITVINIPFKGEELRFGLDSGASSHILATKVLEQHDIPYTVLDTLDLINHNGTSEETYRIQTEAIFSKRTRENSFLIKDLDQFNHYTSANLDGFISVTSLAADFVYINRRKQLCVIGNFE